MKAIGVIRVVKYASRQTGVGNVDSYQNSVDYEAKRDPMQRADIDGKAEVVAMWHLYQIAGQSVQPTRLGRIIDDTVSPAETWHVRQVSRSYGDLKHDCLCTLKPPTSS